MVWLTPKCPVRAEEQTWIEESMDWFVDEFGTDVLRGMVVLPTPEFFPGEYTGSADDVRAVLLRVCGYMDVDPAGIELEFDDEEDDAELLAHLPWYQRQSTFAAGQGESQSGQQQGTAAKPNDSGDAGSPYNQGQSPSGGPVTLGKGDGQVTIAADPYANAPYRDFTR